MSLTLPAPAKLNLFLHITGRRPDGYHTLQTLFQFIDLCDTLTFEATPTGDIQLSPALPGVPNDDNLIVRAARALQRHTGCPQGARIQLEKQLPMGGGLGGGSSNAATTLVALNHLWNTGLSRQELAAIGVQLGADIPIFIHGHAALAEGIGEVFEDAHPPEPCYLIAAPNCHANTAELFQEKQLTRDSKLIKIRDFLAGAGHNDFEPVLRKRFPLVDHCIALMNTEGQAKVTGSGACLFMTCHNKADAHNKLNALLQKMSDFSLEKQDVTWKIAQGLNQSPLYSGPLANQR